MTKRILSILLIICLLLPSVALAAPTESSAYKAMIKMKSKYPEGKKWTNDNVYHWKGGVYSWGAGCMGFAFALSDAAFGSLKARMVPLTEYDGLQVGDILRINNDTHSVILLKVDEDEVTIAEGNYNSSVHWGRTLSRQEVEEITDYVLTRYPQVTSLKAPTGLTARQAEGSNPVVKWNASDKAAYYDVYRNNIKIATVTKTAFTDNTAVPGEKYVYSVTAKAKSDAKIVSSKKSKDAEVKPVFSYADETGSYELCDGTAVFRAPANRNAQKLTIPASVTADDVQYKVIRIEDSACKGMKKLKSLTIGKNVSSIGKNAFAGCKKLKSITVKTTKLGKAGIGSNCFKNISKKATVKVPKKKLKQYSEWFVKTGKMPAKVKFSK